MANYKIGTMLIVSADIELKDFFGDKTLVKKGTKIWIGADNLAHYQDGSIQRLPEDFTIEGYDDRGITERIFAQLKTDLPLAEMCEEYKDEDGVGIGEDIKESIQHALDELGLC